MISSAEMDRLKIELQRQTDENNRLKSEMQQLKENLVVDYEPTGFVESMSI